MSGQSEGSYHFSCWSRTSAGGRVNAQARSWMAAARRRLHVQVPCARIHTLSLTLPAKAERAGDVPSRRAHIHCARKHSLSIHSV